MIVNPKVSIILPVHGDAPYLSAALKSIKSQTFESWEALLVLDRPSEKTVYICSDAANQDGRFRVLDSQLKGISSALNLGIADSRGVYLARIDADDLMKTDRLSIQVNFLDSNPDTICVGSQATYIDPLGRKIGVSNYPQSAGEIRAAIPFVNCVIHPSVLLRKEVFTKIGLYKSTLDGVEDYNLWLRISSEGQIVNLPNALIDYRVHPEQISKKNSSVNNLLQSLARLHFHGAIQEDSQSSWSEYFRSLTPVQQAREVKRLEQKVGLSDRRRLRAARRIGNFFFHKGKIRGVQLFLAVVHAPVAIIALIRVLAKYRLVTDK